MARQKNTVKTSQITISTTPQVRAYLEQLAAGGLHGKTAAEAAERLVTNQIGEMILNKQLIPLPPGAFDESSDDE